MIILIKTKQFRYFLCLLLSKKRQPLYLSKHDAPIINQMYHDQKCKKKVLKNEKKPLLKCLPLRLNFSGII